MTNVAMPGPVERARAAWGADAPAWIMSLASECAASSQTKVAARMGWSGAAISQVLKRQYPAIWLLLKRAFKARFTVLSWSALRWVPCPRMNAGHGAKKRASHHRTTRSG